MLDPSRRRYIPAEQMRDLIAATFDDFVSESIQHLLHEMGRRALERFPQLAALRFDALNRTRDPYGQRDDDPRVKVYSDPFPAYGRLTLAMRRGATGNHEPDQETLPMAGRLTTHVLDTVHGRPAAGTGHRALPDRPRERHARAVVGRAHECRGRTDGPLLAGDALRAGIYELVFSLGDYFAAVGRANAPIPFLDKVPVRFGVSGPGRQLPYPAPGLSLGLLHLPWQLARPCLGYSTPPRGRSASWPAAMNWPPSPRNQGASPGPTARRLWRRRGRGSRNGCARRV